jgi:hypothetical protein
MVWYVFPKFRAFLSNSTRFSRISLVFVDYKLVRVDYSPVGGEFHKFLTIARPSESISHASATIARAFLSNSTRFSRFINRQPQFPPKRRQNSCVKHGKT